MSSNNYDRLSSSNGWQRVHIGDAFRFTQKPRHVRYADYATVPFVPMDYVPAGYPYFERYDERPSTELTSGTYFEPGDLLLAKITPSFENGKQGIVSGLPTPFGVATTEVIPIRGVDGVSDTLFLFYYLLRQDVRAELAEKMEGTTGRQRLAKSTVENATILLPPLEEQQAISATLRNIQDAIEARRRELALERERKAALMQHLFTQGTRGEPRKQTEIGEMPDSWRIVVLGSAARLLQYGTSQRCGEDPLGEPVLRIPNVIRGVIDTSKLKYLPADVREKGALGLSPDDLLFVRTNGRREYVGRCAVYSGEPQNALFASYLIRVRLDPSILLPDFVQYFTATSMGRSQLTNRASNAADGKFNINIQTLRSLLLPHPSLDEQIRIVKILKSVDVKIYALEHELALTHELFHRLLEDLLGAHLKICAPAS